MMTYTTAGLIAANAQNRSLYLRGLGNCAGATVHTPGDVTFIETGMGVLNLVVDVTFTEENADRRIEAVLAHFRERHISCAWNISPLCQPADLADRLRAHGLHYEHDLTYMYIPLEQFQDGPRPEGLTISEVTAPDTWSDLVCAAFDIPEPWRSRCLPVLKGSGAAQGAPYRRYVGTLHGEPVACGALLPDHDGVAGIYWVGTVPGARGKGVGKAMMRHLLGEAVQAGCHLAVLQATADGLPLYRSLGFEALPAAEPSYLWIPED